MYVASSAYLLSLGNERVNWQKGALIGLAACTAELEVDRGIALSKVGTTGGGGRRGAVLALTRLVNVQRRDAGGSKECQDDRLGLHYELEKKTEKTGLRSYVSNKRV